MYVRNTLSPSRALKARLKVEKGKTLLQACLSWNALERRWLQTRPHWDITRHIGSVGRYSFEQREPKQSTFGSVQARVCRQLGARPRIKKSELLQNIDTIQTNTRKTTQGHAIADTPNTALTTFTILPWEKYAIARVRALVVSGTQDLNYQQTICKNMRENTQVDYMYRKYGQFSNTEQYTVFARNLFGMMLFKAQTAPLGR